MGKSLANTIDVEKRIKLQQNREGDSKMLQQNVIKEVGIKETFTSVLNYMAEN